MTQKDGQSAAEKFTLQFGEADGEALSTEPVSPDAAFLDDQFMWRSTAAVLQNVAVAAPAPIVEAVEAVSPASKPASKPADTHKPADTQPEAEDVAPRAVETVVSDARQDSLVGSVEAVPDYDDMDDEPMVVDERQAEIVTVPDHLSRKRPHAGVAAVGGDGFGEVGPGDVSADAQPRFDEMPGASTTLKAVPPLFLNDGDGPSARLVGAGTKTPWILYGTLGLGVAVLAVAFTGMLLQMGKQPEAAGTVDVASIGGQVAPPETPAVITETRPVPVADPDVDLPLTAAGPINVQLKVFRLAVGPFVENDSLLSRFEIDPPVNSARPVAVLASQPGTAFVADLGATLPLSVAVETGGNFGVSAEETAVVTLKPGRVEIDLSNDVATDIAGGAPLTSGAPSGIVDPKIVMASVPALSSAQTQPVESPLDVLASRTLFEAISQLSEDVATLDSAVLAGQAGDDLVAPVQVGSAAVEQAPKRGTFRALGSYDVASLTKVGLVAPRPLEVPLAAVRVVPVGGANAPVEGTVEGVWDMAEPVVVPVLTAPLAFAALTTPQPNLPSPSVDISRELIAEARAKEAVDRAKAAGLIAQQAAARAKEAEAAALKAEAAVQKLSDGGPADVVVAQAETSQVVDAPVSAGIAATAVVAPDQTEAVVPDVASGSWVSEARWQADLGFDFTPVVQNGRNVLEIANLQGGSVLPGWAKDGTTIESINDVSAVDEAAFWGALVNRSDPTETGEVSASLELRIRADFDPRRAAIEVPVWRSVALSDGTEISIKRAGGKWIATVVASDESNPTGLKPGDILLRDFITKSNLRDPLSVEAVFDAMDEAGQTEVEFAIMRDGELSSGKLGL